MAARARGMALIVPAMLPWLCCAPAGAGKAAPAADPATLVRMRADALTRTRVWQQPATPIAEADLRTRETGTLTFADRIDCRYQMKLTSGITPKFHCVLPDGRLIKVKYGRLNAEPRAERAATRLLSTLGFGADRMHFVKRVRCRGCPVYPHPRWGPLNSLFARRGESTDFENVAVEEPMPGRPIEAGDAQGWAWYDLDKVDPARGGASRAELDAFRLMAVFLADWDNKAVNQGLICLPAGDRPDGGCDAPFAYLQDVGATFGPKGLDLEAWRATPIWADPSTCLVSMKSLPYHGATFRDRTISEAGRRFLADELKQLRSQQVRDLFVAADFTDFAKSSAAGRDVENWVAAFDDKVRQIADRPPCPEP